MKKKERKYKRKEKRERKQKSTLIFFISFVIPVRFYRGWGNALAKLCVHYSQGEKMRLAPSFAYVVKRASEAAVLEQVSSFFESMLFDRLSFVPSFQKSQLAAKC